MQKELTPMPRTRFRSAYRRFLTTFVLWALIAFGLIAPPGAVAQDGWKAVDPSGIYYAVERSVLHPDRWGNEFQNTYDCVSPCVVALDDRLSGVHLRYKWAQLNPRDGVYDFDALGQVLDTIHDAGKSATLTVMAGKYTPSWVIDAGAGHIWVPAKTSDEYSQQFVPSPWDPIFLTAHRKMIEALARYLKQTPDRYRTVVAVRNAAVVVHSGETRLMAIKAFDVDVRKADRRAVRGLRRTLCMDWAQAGYSEQRVIQAVRNVNDQLASSFPDQYIALAYIGGSNRFPTIGPNGKCRPKARNKTVRKIVKETVSSYGPRAIIVNTVLTPDFEYTPLMNWVRSNGGQIGFQVDRPIVGCSRGSTTSCDDAELRAAIQVAIDYGAVFVEVHDGNINRHRSILREMNSALRRR